MRESGESLIAQLGVTPGLRVLDLGCGDGTTAIPMAKRGAKVLGVDIARNLVTAGNLRADKEKLDNISFQEGDASNLDGLSNHSFRFGSEHLRSHVCATPHGRCKRDGKGDKAGRKNCDG